MGRSYNSSSAYRNLDFENESMERFRARSVRAVKRKASSAQRVSTATHAPQLSKKKLAARRRRNSLRMIASVMVLLSLAFLMLFRYSAIVERTQEVARLQQEYDNLSSANKRLQVSIDSALNLTNIEETAVNELGMCKPEKYQLVYLDILGDDHVSLPQGAQGNRGMVRQFYATIIQTLGNVLEYLY